jgi:hypothetical protein
MLAATISTFAAVDRAKAACDPVSPIVGTNVTVTCTGTTDNQNDPFGYGSVTDSGNTINVLSGASVTGTDVGVLMHDGTVNNDGLIEATGGGGSVAAVLREVLPKAALKTFGAEK